MNITFENWMKRVDTYCQHVSGLSCYDLSDTCYHDKYDMGDSPSETARQLLEEEGFPFDED